MQSGNRAVVEQKLKDHFGSIRNLVDQQEQKMKDKFEALQTEQSNRLNQVNGAVEEQLDQLCNADLNLSSLEGHEDQALVYMLNIVQSEKEKLIDFKPQIPFEQVSVTLQLNENLKQKVIEALQKSSKLDLDDLRYEDHSKISF